MLTVLSPAKSLNFDAAPVDIPTTQPELQKHANELATHARKLSVSDLRGLMKISEDLAQLNQKRFKSFQSRSTDRNAKQAALAFAGDTYIGLMADSFDADDMAFAQDNLRILSGLYGVLRPLDRIQPYRLEMGSRLHHDDGIGLYKYWGNQIAKKLDKAANKVVLNCASNEYFKAAGPHLKSRIITPHFKEEKSNELKMIGFFAKRARGAMARYVVTNRITDPEDAKGFDLDGYGFRADLSNETDWVFTRPATT